MTIERITGVIEDLIVLETKAINKEVITQTITLGSTSLNFNSKIHLLVTMVIDLHNPFNRHSLSKTHIEIMNQFLNKNRHHHKNSNSHNNALASMHQTEISLYNKNDQSLTIFSNNQMK